MKKIILIIFFLFLYFNHVIAKVEPNDVSFPKHFYIDEIRSCPYVGTAKFDTKNTLIRIKSLKTLDWMSEWAKGNSRSVNHQNLTKPMKLFAIATHNAMGEQNEDNIKIAKSILVDLAKSEFLFNTIGKKELKRKPKCWANGDGDSPCWYHAYEFARDSFANLMVLAIYLKEFLDDDELTVLNAYIKKMNKKFIQPDAFNNVDKGFYAMGNGGIPNLIYAHWSDNKNLAAKEFNFRFMQINKLFYEDGYINNNSFRGYRGLWYHSYGLNSALGYVYLANLWGAKVPEKILFKLTQASRILNLGISDYEKYASRKYDGEQNNNKYKKKHARMHTHQEAIAIDTLMEMVTGIILEYDAIYLQKRREKGIDDLVGFNANCIK